MNDQAKATPAGRPTPLPLKLLLMAVVLVATLGLAEAGLRAVWSGQGRPFSQAAALAEIDKAATLLQEGVDRGVQDANAASQAPDDSSGKPNQAEIRQFLHPYFGWDTDRIQPEYLEGRITFRQPRAKRSFDVLVLGGSVAASFGWTGRQGVFEVLSADPRLKRRGLRMFNHGIAGYKQPQQVNRLAFLFALGFTPDLVINLDGFNEVALGHQNSTSGVNPLYPSSGHWKRMMAGSATETSDLVLESLGELRFHQRSAEACARRCEELGLQRSALTTELAVWWIRRIRARGLEAYERFLGAGEEVGESDALIFGPAFEGRTPLVLELLVETWANCSLAMHGMCQARGIDYIHVLQPTLHDKGSKPLTQEELDSSGCASEWRLAAELGYPMLRKTGAQLSAAGVNFFDASRVFADVQETLYFDACHFVRAGQDQLGRAIARAYLERLPAEGPSDPVSGFRAPFFREQD